MWCRCLLFMSKEAGTERPKRPWERRDPKRAGGVPHAIPSAACGPRFQACGTNAHGYVISTRPSSYGRDARLRTEEPGGTEMAVWHMQIRRLQLFGGKDCSDAAKDA